jgi:hypothetical protein
MGQAALTVLNILNQIREVISSALSGWQLRILSS